MSKLRVFEAFAGVGSQSMALRNLGIDFEVVGISEVDRYALLSYDAIHNEQNEINIPSKEGILKELNDKHVGYNFSNGKSEIPKNKKKLEELYQAHIRSKNFGDIRLINPKDLPQMDLFTYSFPCKCISLAGHQEGLEEGSGTQSSLVWECFKIIEYHKPKYLLMENVKNLVGRKFKPQFDIICQKLEELGYNNYWSVMNGKDFNVPQNRERVMMISIRKDIDKGYKLPIGTPLNKTIFDVLENNIESKYYLSDVCIEKMKRFMPSGEVTEYVCPTLTTELAHSTGKNLYPKLCKILGEYRRLTPLECWRLMGYSDEDFYKAKNIGGLSDTKLYERSARGIVVPMLEEIFRNLLL